MFDDEDIEDYYRDRPMTQKQLHIKNQLMQLGNNVALANVSFSNLTEKQCEALQYCINNIKTKLNQAKRNHFHL